MPMSFLIRTLSAYQGHRTNLLFHKAADIFHLNNYISLYKLYQLHRLYYFDFSHYMELEFIQEAKDGDE